MEMSENVGELIAALSKFRAEVGAVVKRGKNPHLKSSFTRLEDIWGAIPGALHANGLTTNQFYETDSANAVKVTTFIGHKSNQWMRSTALMPADAGRGVTAQQAHGVAYTYLDRYALMAALGLPGVDDDGEGTRGKGEDKAPTVDLSALRAELESVADKDALAAVRVKLEALPKAVKPQLVGAYKDAAARVEAA